MNAVEALYGRRGKQAMQTMTFGKLLKRDLQRTASWYVVALYALGPVIPGLAVEWVARRNGVVAAVGYLLILAVLVAVVCFGRAVFKGFHHLLFVDKNYPEEVAGIAPSRVCLSKFVVAALWLLGVFLVVAQLFGMHLFLIERMGEAAQSDTLQIQQDFLHRYLGEGVYLGLSCLSLFCQALLIIGVTYVAAAASHLSFFERYKTLAGIFLLVALYVFESDLAGTLRRMGMGLLGGVQQVASTGIGPLLRTTAALEVIACLLLCALNIAMVTYIMKRKGESQWNRQA